MFDNTGKKKVNFFCSLEILPLISKNCVFSNLLGPTKMLLEIIQQW